jgi:uncharacterized Ntn-hydrolase superfamily protein
MLRLIAFILTLTYTSSVFATFSICAVDPATGFVGSAGASCHTDCRILTDVHPGWGVVHTQASWLAANQSYARILMNMHLSPQQIIDSVVLHDAQNNPTVRQYGIVDLYNGGRSAGYTGVNCLNWKGHILGPTYAIQGNILLGQHILDSMQTRFLNTPGSLAHKLMAALQGAKVIGADTRCNNNQTSSLSAFLRIARPQDTTGTYYVDLYARNLGFGRDPIDSLQSLFNLWITGANNISTEVPKRHQLFQNFPNPFNPSTSIKFDVLKKAFTSITVYNINGQQAEKLVMADLPPGTYYATWDAFDFPSGTYFYTLETGGYKETKKMLLIK